MRETNRLPSVGPSTHPTPCHTSTPCLVHHVQASTHGPGLRVVVAGPSQGALARGGDVLQHRRHGGHEQGMPCVARRRGGPTGYTGLSCVWDQAAGCTTRRLARVGTPTASTTCIRGRSRRMANKRCHPGRADGCTTAETAHLGLVWPRSKCSGTGSIHVQLGKQPTITPTARRATICDASLDRRTWGSRTTGGCRVRATAYQWARLLQGRHGDGAQNVGPVVRLHVHHPVVVYAWTMRRLSGIDMSAQRHRSG